jgi:DNA-binding HxlR family transcriptional regulator
MTQTTTPQPAPGAAAGLAAAADASAGAAAACEEVTATVVRCDAALTHVFEILGKRWNGVIVGALSSGPASFSQISRGVSGISDSVLSERLTGLAGAGIVSRDVESGPPVSVSYRLTDAGRALLPAMDELRRWAERHLAPPA